MNLISFKHMVGFPINSKILGFFAISLIVINGSNAQSEITGKISDRESGASLPFVHITLTNTAGGAVSNIQGIYKLNRTAGSSSRDSVLFSYIGYRDTSISWSALKAEPNVKLKSKSESLQEVVIKAKEDPAYAMVRKAVNRKKQNNPEELPHYSFTSYNKANVDFERNDSIQSLLENPGFRNAHFFMMESATEVIYLAPRRHEKVVASKMSGIRNPTISMISNSFQPFACYDNYLKIVQFEYLNPLSPNSRARYQFTLRDSARVYGEKVYIISFEPRKNASENLLEGTLSLGADNFALVNFVAGNSGDVAAMYFEVRQAYRKVGTMWFPEESNTVYRFPEMQVEGDMIISSTTYIEDIDLENKPDKDAFKLAGISVADSVGLLDDSQWKKLRSFELDSNESNTYAVYDTLPKKMLNSMNWLMNQSTSIANGRLNFGKVDVLLNHLLAFNDYEKFRLGLGLATSPKLLKWMSLEAYFAYGFGDKEIKYGGGMRFFIYPERELTLSLLYRNDVNEPGRHRFSRDIGYRVAGENIRNFFTQRMNPVEQYEANLKYRPMRGILAKPYFIHEERTIERKDYLDDLRRPESAITTNTFGLELRYVPGEELVQTGNTLMPMNLSYPRFNLDVATAIDGFWNANNTFSRADLSFSHLFRIRGLGETQLFGNAGKTFGNHVAYPFLSFSRGGLGESDFGILSIGYFQSMQPYEFLNDAYVHAGFIHNFGSVFGIEKSFTKPTLKLSYQAAIGSLQQQNSEAVPFAFQKMDKPYLEGGLIIDNILRSASSFAYQGYGVGVFYRHGHFGLDKFGDNLSFILSVAISL